MTRRLIDLPAERDSCFRGTAVVIAPLVDLEEGAKIYCLCSIEVDPELENVGVGGDLQRRPALLGAPTALEVAHLTGSTSHRL